MKVPVNALDTKTHDSPGRVNASDSHGSKPAVTAAALPLIPTLSQSPDAPPHRKLPQVRLRPRTRWNRSQDSSSCIYSVLSRTLTLQSPAENSIAKRKQIPLQEPILPFSSSNNSDKDIELPSRSRHDQDLTGGTAIVHSDEACANDDDSSSNLRSRKKTRASPPCLVQFQDSNTMNTSSIVTPTTLPAFQAIHASQEESLPKPRPVRRLLFPTSTSALRKSERDSSSRQNSLAGSASQWS
jgi:hypothetical protein